MKSQLILLVLLDLKHWLKLAAWLHITVASLADLSHLRRVSCDILREAGGVEDSPECLAIQL